MIDVGILTPHGAAGADDELTTMAGADVRTRLRRISLLPDGSVPTSPEDLRAHAAPSVVDDAAVELDPRSLQAMAYASTITAYAIGRRLERVLWNDPATGVMRNADAGYDIAKDCAQEKGLRLPGILKGSVP